MNVAAASAASGIAAASDQFARRSADTLAAANARRREAGDGRDAGETPDLAAAIVGMIEAKTAFKASIAAARAINDMTGALIDITA